jgi:hypothetical protein
MECSLAETGRLLKLSGLRRYWQKMICDPTLRLIVLLRAHRK